MTFKQVFAFGIIMAFVGMFTGGFPHGIWMGFLLGFAIGLLFWAIGAMLGGEEKNKDK